MSTVRVARRPLLGEPFGWDAGVDPVLQQVYAARGVFDPAQVEHRLQRMLPPHALGGMAAAVTLLAEAIRDDWSIVIAGDYDCDGATGTAVGVRGLRLLGARRVSYVIPNRFVHGYGLSPALVASLQQTPQLLVTVDNGVSSVAGVAAARARGIRVIVTDHHLPGEQLPAADAIVNPNVLGEVNCQHASPPCASCARDAYLNAAFPSRALAGVGVMFYLLLALRAKLFPSASGNSEPSHGAPHDGEPSPADLREHTPRTSRPDLAPLLDLVALGTVADLVPLDFNNRILVEAGMKRLRSGRGTAGITALIEASQRSVNTLCASDLGYAVGPRLNAAGRMEDMALGVECLLTDDPAHARRLAGQLSAINVERRDLQAAMLAEAEVMVERLARTPLLDAVGVTLFEPSWHAGVIGLVASKLKDRLHRPVIAFAPANPDEWAHGDASGDPSALLESGESQAFALGVLDAAASANGHDQRGDLRGSARSIAGFHIRDALALVDARHPGLIERFGGHAMAAGLSLPARNYATFAAAFGVVAREQLNADHLQAVLYTDGELPAGAATLALARQLRYAGPWGQGFPEPLFENLFDCVSWRPMGERHWRLNLRDPRDRSTYEAVMFNVLTGAPPSRMRAVYELVINDWQGRESARLLLRHIEPG